MLQPRKHQTVACDSCKKRKVKCDGLSPCYICVARSNLCVYSAQAKRGPRSTKKLAYAPYEPKFAVSSSTPIFSNEEASNTGVNLFMQQRQFGEVADRTRAFREYSAATRGCVAEFLVEQDVILPSTPAQRCQLYVVLAILSRTNNDRSLADKYYKEAESIMTSVYEDVSEDSAVATMLMGYYNPTHSNKCYVYTTLSAILADRLKPSQRRSRLLKFSNIIASISDPSRADKLVEYLHINSNDDTLYDLLMNLQLQISACMKGVFTASYSFKKSRATLSKELSDQLLQAATTGEQLISNNMDQASVSVLLLFKIFKILVLWQSGNTQEAASVALESLQFANDRTADLVYATDLVTLMTLFWCLKETPHDAAIKEVENWIRRLSLCTNQLEFLEYISPKPNSNPTSTSSTNYASSTTTASESQSSNSSFSNISPPNVQSQFSPPSLSNPAPSHAQFIPPSLFNQSYNQLNQTFDDNIGNNSNYNLEPNNYNNDIPKQYVLSLQQQVTQLQQQILTINQQLFNFQVTPPVSTAINTHQIDDIFDLSSNLLELVEPPEFSGFI